MTSTVILSDNGASSGSAGLKQTAGNDGVLILQTTTSGGTATNAIYVDTSQNVGLNATPSAWGSPYKALSVNGIFNSIAGNSTYGLDLVSNAYYSSGWKYTNSSVTALKFDANDTAAGQFTWQGAGTGTADGAITWTTRMVLDASGNLIVGGTTTFGGGAWWTKSFTVNGSTGSTSDAGVDIIGYRTGDGDVGGVGFLNAASSNARIATIYGERSGANNSGALTFHTMNAGTSAERARITSSGYFLVSTSTVEGRGTTLYGGGGNGFYVRTTSTCGYLITQDGTGGSGTYLTLYSNNTSTGSISTNGSTTSYNTTSDYRLKEDVAPMTGALEKVAALKPVTYKWKSDGSDGQGFIAHELQAVVPDAVTGEKDGTELVEIKDGDGNVTGTEERPAYQSIDTSFLVATLTAAIQEQQAIITSLTERISALEGAQK